MTPKLFWVRQSRMLTFLFLTHHLKFLTPFVKKYGSYAVAATLWQLHCGTMAQKNLDFENNIECPKLQSAISSHVHDGK